ncbi:MAG: hypothetical protein MJ071_06585 [Oscillospiraceae bacterium]|nr:hypothetical protein [Oscillospiraceae bacterium]
MNIDMMKLEGELYAKYPDYRPVGKEKLPFQPAANDREMAVAKETKKKRLVIMLAVTIALAAIVILSIAAKSFLGAILCGFMTLICSAVLIQMLKTEVTFLSATVFAKTFEYNVNRNKTGRHKDCYIIVKTEYPERMISDWIQIPPKNYDRIEEGTACTIVRYVGTYTTMDLS